MNRPFILILGIAAVTGITWLWHGPLGAADGLAAKLEKSARVQLDRDEMTRVEARVMRDPVTRRLVLSGPADDFQRREIKRRMEALPGVGEAVWDPGSLQSEAAR
jgi:hypothetical protein